MKFVLGNLKRWKRNCAVSAACREPLARFPKGALGRRCWATVAEAEVEAAAADFVAVKPLTLCSGAIDAAPCTRARQGRVSLGGRRWWWAGGRPPAQGQGTAGAACLGALMTQVKRLFWSTSAAFALQRLPETQLQGEQGVQFSPLPRVLRPWLENSCGAAGLSPCSARWNASVLQPGCCPRAARAAGRCGDAGRSRSSLKQLALSWFIRLLPWTGSWESTGRWSAAAASADDIWWLLFAFLQLPANSLSRWRIAWSMRSELFAVGRSFEFTVQI